LVPDIIDKELISSVLNVNIITPIKGKKKQLLDMACNNAKKALEDKFEIINRDEKSRMQALEELKSLLKLDSVNRIEAFDNSHLFGTFSVSGMVVFTLGKKDKNEYRKYKITSIASDDYNIMKEVIYRRYFKVLMEDLEKPNLIIVDGGKPQIKAALETLNELNLNIPVCGLVKNDKHRTSGILYNNEILNIDKTSYLFHLLENIQDEVHNFTIRYHKDIRSKGALESVLDDIAGIGEKRKKELLKKYSNINKMKEASIEELSKILPKDVAEHFHDYLNNLT
jgi:excinuclease ABC subunit C